jgi:hypothetical protein
MPIGALVLRHVDGTNLKIIVGVVLIHRRDALEKSLHVREEQWLVLVDLHRCGSVLGKHAHQTIPDARVFYVRNNMRSDVDELWGLGCL